MKHDNHLKSALRIIETFKGDIPLHLWLKKFFRENKQIGSRDRKVVSEMVYCFFRLGHAEKKIATDERILLGLFLCNNTSNEILQYFRPSWNDQISLNIEEKANIIQPSILLSEIFPWKDQLSTTVNHESFCKSFLQQPDLFARIRPGYEKPVREKLQKAAIAFTEINPSCLSFPNATKLDSIVELNKEAVIQDLSSQQISELIKLSTLNCQTSAVTAWDCCAGSGGKSIMLHDMYPAADITVSDIRESILINLKKRFREAGIKKYHSFAKDLSTNQPSFTIDHSPFDIIIADLPCSGSGTWSRTPEALYFFDIAEIEKYNSLQKKIVSNAIPYLKKGGTFLYITCSVFKKENEEIVDFIQDKFHLRMLKSKLFKGFDQKSDSMFAAAFTA